jgi:hypothetical protein
MIYIIQFSHPKINYYLSLRYCNEVHVSLGASYRQFSRGFQAAIMLPFALALWMLMGGAARLLANLFGDKQGYATYLKITGFTFFTIWVIAAIIDAMFSDVFWTYIARGLQGEFGPVVDSILTYFMPLEYTILYGLVAVNVTIATRAVEGFAWWKAAMIGIAVFAWPMMLVSAIVR